MSSPSSNNEEVCHHFLATAIVACVIAIITSAVMWNTAKPSDEVTIRAVESTVDCDWYRRQRDFYKLTYGEEAPKAKRGSEYYECSTESPYSEPITYADDGKAGFAVVPFEDARAWFPSRTEEKSSYCKKLPCKP